MLKNVKDSFKTYMKRRSLRDKFAGFDEAFERSAKVSKSSVAENNRGQERRIVVESVENIPWRENLSRQDYSKWLMEAKFPLLRAKLQERGVAIEGCKIRPGAHEGLLSLKLLVSFRGKDQVQKFYRSWQELKSSKTVFSSARAVKNDRRKMVLYFDVKTNAKQTSRKKYGSKHSDRGPGLEAN